MSRTLVAGNKKGLKKGGRVVQKMGERFMRGDGSRRRGE